MRLINRTAIITGAGGGIGQACAKAFAKEGINLVLVDISEKAVEETKALGMSIGAQTISFEADICSEAAVDTVVKRAADRFGAIDILINLAGIQGPGAPVWDASPEAWRKCVEINLFGTFLMCSKVSGYMIKSGYGRIVNVASGAGVHPMPNFSAYSASKAGVIHFSRTIAEELKSYGITVNSVGVHAVTPMWKDVLEAKQGGNTASNLRDMINNGFSPAPEENVPVLLFLASEESGHVTGQYFEANALPGCLVNKR
jgi:3-oxoacyl-[acyl-carrier protein] reductase